MNTTTERESYMARIARFCEAHGADARAHLDCVIARIPWTHRDRLTGDVTRGEDVLALRTFSQARQALGY
jgi:hypothetical protein